ncbi:hypothetical protein [Lacrimispora sp. 210928-DFI.3.58]|uniref:hypothetical protein n=1 Tax=Lacrimispora sp. 210928-DFI.3.58 TaxID=2883214 RepID=UPI001D05C4C9|nr:hypothetical protein [Lacrimispora sp. 210928-DFI.3.58]MCB7317528.1 hypothetical protein [Lacrimispora sp. 210928-DFI.3.58]
MKNEEKNTEASGVQMENAGASGVQREKMVSFMIPKGRNELDRADVFVGVNGKSYLIKRGVVVDMPEAVVEVLKNSAAQNDYAIQVMEKLKEQEIKEN